jgi:hypothetical protein
MTWRDHQGQQVLVLDYRGGDEAELLSVLDEGVRIVSSTSPGVLMLSDFRGTPVGPDWMKAVKDSNGKVFGPQQTKIAVTGIDGIKGVLLKGFNAVSKGVKATPFDNEEKALAYLVG